MKKWVDWSDRLSANGLAAQWRQNYRMYLNADPYGVGFGDNAFSVVGTNGELLRISVNHVRNLVTHILNMTTAERPSLSAKATNAESQSIMAAELFDGVLEYYLRTKRCERHLRRAVEQSLVFGTGFLLLEWDTMLGKPYMVGPDGQPVNDGDLSIRTCSVYDVCIDNDKEYPEDLEWAVVRHWENRYNVAHRYPDMQDKILALPGRMELERKTGGSYGWQSDNEDIPVYTFYHAPSAALPNGRRTVILSEELVPEDFENPYGQVPLLWIRPSEGMGTVYGYAPTNDLAPLQVFYNLLYSTIATNQAMFGVQNIAVERGSDIQFKQLMGGMNLIEYTPQTKPPEPLNLVQTPKEIFDMLELNERQLETISGVNSVARGNPEHSLKSGVALNIVQSMATQFQSGLTGSYAQLLEDMGNLMLKIFRKFAQTERMIGIVGKNKVIKSKSWSGSSFDDVDSVVCEITSPLSRTIAGRRDMATELLNSGLIKTTQEYFTVLETGQLEPLYRSEISGPNLIRDENDQLIEAQPVPVLRTDDHELHIREHKCLLDAPMIRRQGNIVNVVLGHIMEHEQFLAQQMAQMQQQQMAAQGGPPGQGPEQG